MYRLYFLCLKNIQIMLLIAVPSSTAVVKESHTRHIKCSQKLGKGTDCEYLYSSVLLGVRKQSDVVTDLSQTSS